MSKRIKVNSKLMLVDPELMQTVLNSLQLLTYGQVYSTIDKLLQLQVLPIKDYTLFVPEEDTEKVEQTANNTK